jgi:signal transduction histidine kinase
MGASGILLIVILAQIRIMSMREKILPHLYGPLRTGIIIASVALALTNAPFVGTIAEVVIDLALLALIFIVYNVEELRNYRSTMYAYLPFILISVLKHVLGILPDRWEEEIESYIDAAIGFAFVWMVGMLVVANKQKKALRAERLAREDEERMKRLAEEKKAELELMVAERTREITRQKEELQQVVENLKETQDQLIHAEKMASLGELTAGIAHEIQNPLNFVNNFSEVNMELAAELGEEIQHMNLQETDRTNLISIVNNIRQNQEKINYHGKRADNIVKGMLQHSRTGTGQKEPVDLNDLLDEYVRLSYHGLRAKDKSFNATIDMELDPSVGKVPVIPQDIGRAMLNILNNAFYAVNEKKKSDIPGYTPILKVTSKLVDRGRKWVYITIRDNGNGIPQTIREKIFQPFFTTKPTGKGTGLGLSLSYDIISKGHGGELKFSSKEGEYTEFVMKLPAETTNS